MSKYLGNAAIVPGLVFAIFLISSRTVLADAGSTFGSKAAAGGFVIEGEDFNFGGGQHSPQTDIMPYPGGAHWGLGAIRGVDFDRSSDAPLEADAYRAGEEPNVGIVEMAADLVRPGYVAATNYSVGWNTPGSWYNYTRRIPINMYRVRLALRGVGPVSGKVEQLVQNGTNGSVRLVGRFQGAGTGSFLSATNEMVSLDSGGWVDSGVENYDCTMEVTLRVHMDAGDLDYIVLEPAGAIDFVFSQQTLLRLPDGRYAIEQSAPPGCLPLLVGRSSVGPFENAAMEGPVETPAGRRYRFVIHPTNEVHFFKLSSQRHQFD